MNQFTTCFMMTRKRKTLNLIILWSFSNGSLGPTLSLSSSWAQYWCTLRAPLSSLSTLRWESLWDALPEKSKSKSREWSRAREKSREEISTKPAQSLSQIKCCLISKMKATLPPHLLPMRAVQKTSTANSECFQAKRMESSFLKQ